MPTDIVVIVAGTTASHFAYNVVFDVIVSVAKLNLFVNSSSLYHPPNVYSSFVGSVGLAIVSPLVTFVIFATGLPPFELNVTVYVVCCTYSASNTAYNVIIGAVNVYSTSFETVSPSFFPLLHSTNLYPVFGVAFIVYSCPSVH